ncbi:LOW QUALITY PROTEIN: syntaphilin [Alosa sapidissima]|uniref:LOW QUALITY PROTEIN: syntaphilin n=1 Tax=Alosa sapidissima TaxID=34773 RepID=UPI001C093C4C|nr:LOW QUALITY PROTEIN: syntaphilin [Alosa sapidissima]
MSAPVSKRSAAGSHRFNPLKSLQPKRRLQQMLLAQSAAQSAPASAPPSAPPLPAFDYCRFIELDYIPMETGYMVSMRPTQGYLAHNSPERHCRRSPAPVSSRDPYGNASLSSSSNSGSCKGSDCSPTSRRNVKYTSCTDNHGIRPPPPEQYLTPLQQKEVCIRHLRARLKETVDRLQDRDSEIDELRTQLSRMQEDWIEEECHRVEAQLALKEAQQEIQQLKQVVDVVRCSLGTHPDTGMQKCFQDINLQNHKLETLLHSMELAQTGTAHKLPLPPGEEVALRAAVGAAVGGGGGPAAVPAELEVGEGQAGGSCDGSPARSLTRSSTYTKLSDHAPRDRSSCGSGCGSACGSTSGSVRGGDDFPCLSAEGTQDSGFVCCGESAAANHADLLLEAAFLSKETASLLSSYRLPHASTYERLVPLHCGTGPSASASHPCLSHHHLYLHHLREQAIQTDCAPASAPAHGYGPAASDLDTIAEQRTFRSQACSPTSTWFSDEGDDLDLTTVSVTTTTMTATTTAPEAASVLLPIDPPSELPLPLDPPDPPSELPLPLDPPDRPLPSPTSSSEAPPQTSQPRSVGSPVPSSEALVEAGVLVVEEGGGESEAAGEAAGSSPMGPPVKSYWSRHFLVDLLAVAVPVVPTVAWLCRAPRRDGQPLYHFGSLLRGCCTVALTSLRRGGGVRHYPAGGGGGRTPRGADLRSAGAAAETDLASSPCS